VCVKGEVMCSRTCTDLSDDPMNCGQCGHDCGSGLCVSGQCVCYPGAQMCMSSGPGVQCADLQASRQNCGACGHACQSDQECVNGTCQ
jgi:hypothetical protein